MRRVRPGAIAAALPAALLALGAGCSFDPAALAGGGGGDGPGATDGGTLPDGGPSPDGRPVEGDPDAAVEEPGAVSCARTAQPPELDGTADGPWDSVSWIRFEAEEAELIADKHGSYQFDAELRFACLHDDDAIYFFIEVQDDLIRTNSLSLREDDAVVLFIDGDGDRSGPYSASDHALVITAEPQSLDYGPGTLEPDGTRVLTDAGYDLEIGLARASISDPLPAVLGFNIALIDDDGHGNNDRDLFALWHVPEPPACTSCCEGQAAPWCNTAVTGQLVLED